MYFMRRSDDIILSEGRMLIRSWYKELLVKTAPRVPKPSASPGRSHCQRSFLDRRDRGCNLDSQTKLVIYFGATKTRHFTPRGVKYLRAKA